MNKCIECQKIISPTNKRYCSTCFEKKRLQPLRDKCYCGILLNQHDKKFGICQSCYKSKVKRCDFCCTILKSKELSYDRCEKCYVVDLLNKKESILKWHAKIFISIPYSFEHNIPDDCECNFVNDIRMDKFLMSISITEILKKPFGTFYNKINRDESLIIKHVEILMIEYQDSEIFNCKTISVDDFLTIFPKPDESMKSCLKYEYSKLKNGCFEKKSQNDLFRNKPKKSYKISITCMNKKINITYVNNKKTYIYENKLVILKLKSLNIY